MRLGFVLVLLVATSCTIDVQIDKKNLLPDAAITEDANRLDSRIITTDADIPSDASQVVPDAFSIDNDAMPPSN